MPTFNKEKTNKIKKIDSLFKMVYLRPKNNKTLSPISSIKIDEIVILAFLLIGDTIMYIPFFKTIRKNYPNAIITVVCESVTKIILEDQNIIDNFIIVNCPWIVKTDYSLKNILNFRNALKVINQKEYDLAIDFRGDWRNIFYLNFIKAERKASFNFTGGEYMLTDVIIPDERIENFTDESLYLLESLDIIPNPDDKIPSLSLSNERKQYLSFFINRNNIGNEFIIGVHPGSSQEVKKWSEEKYGELVVKLNQYQRSKFFIFQGPNEEESVLKVTSILRSRGIDYLIVKEKLIDYMAIISLCKLMICNDSGAGHIAGAYGISTVVIFGNVDPKYIISKNAKHVKAISHALECKPCFKSYCKFGHKKCIEDISVSEVFEASTDLVSNSNSKYDI